MTRGVVLVRAGCIRGGSRRLYLVKLDQTSGAITLHDAFHDADGKPGFDFLLAREWLHGWKGSGLPHGVVFSLQGRGFTQDKSDASRATSTKQKWPSLLHRLLPALSGIVVASCTYATGEVA